MRGLWQYKDEPDVAAFTKAMDYWTDADVHSLDCWFAKTVEPAVSVSRKGVHLLTFDKFDEFTEFMQELQEGSDEERARMVDAAHRRSTTDYHWFVPSTPLERATRITERRLRDAATTAAHTLAA